MILNILVLLAYLISLVVLVNRYILGTVLKIINIQPKVDYYPTVTIVVPCYNEGEHIYHTVRSLCKSEYPKQLLKVFVIDDCSKDDSYEWACKAKDEEKHIEVQVYRAKVNQGKRKNISQAVRLTDSEIVVSVDSDVIVASDAIKRLISLFSDASIGAVGGQVSIANPNENWLTKMQAIKYFYGYEYLKSLENQQKQVMCLSGCLTAYRRRVLLEIEPNIENRNILGVPIKYGEDRFLTRQIVMAGYKTIINVKARCYTKAPASVLGYFKQQLRWRRSNFADFLYGILHPTDLTPIVAMNYYTIFAIQILYPVILMQLFINWYIIPSIALHMVLLACMGLFYRWQTQEIPKQYRTEPLWFITLAVIMPITYVLLSIVAFLTLDSGSWETRSKGG